MLFHEPAKMLFHEPVNMLFHELAKMLSHKPAAIKVLFDEPADINVL